MKQLKKYLAVAVCLILGALLLIPAIASIADVDVSRPANAHMAFNDEGKLKILQMADIQDDEVMDPLAKKSLKRAIEASDPDLIILTGDNIGGYSCKTKAEGRAAIKSYMDILEKYVCYEETIKAE